MNSLTPITVLEGTDNQLWDSIVSDDLSLTDYILKIVLTLLHQV